MKKGDIAGGWLSATFMVRRERVKVNTLLYGVRYIPAPVREALPRYYSPRNTGSRFSTKAVAPSLWSSVWLSSLIIGMM